MGLDKAPPSGKTTARLRSPTVINMPMVEISKGDITDILRIETPARDVTSAFDEVKKLWKSGEVDYVAAAIVFDIHKYEGYMIYTPEKGVVTPDPSVVERLNFLKRIAKEYGGLDGVYIDTVRCPEDSYDLHIAKVVVCAKPRM